MKVDEENTFKSLCRRGVYWARVWAVYDSGARCFDGYRGKDSALRMDGATFEGGRFVAEPIDEAEWREEARAA